MDSQNMKQLLDMGDNMKLKINSKQLKKALQKARFVNNKKKGDKK
jgi:hypothetical protein